MLFRNERIGAVEAEGRANGRYRALENELRDTMIRSKAQIHNLRARYKAHETVEKAMGEVIAKYEPGNIFTDPAEVEKKVDALQVEYASNLDVIKMTYPSGKVEGNPYPLEVMEDPERPGVMISVTRKSIA